MTNNRLTAQPIDRGGLVPVQNEEGAAPPPLPQPLTAHTFQRCPVPILAPVSYDALQQSHRPGMPQRRSPGILSI